MKENVTYKKQPLATIAYKDHPSDWPDPKDLEVVEDDFLPKPEDLAFKKTKSKKVTINLDTEVIDYFKEEAKRLNAPYQRMIRNLVSDYVGKQKKAKTHRNKAVIAN